MLLEAVTEERKDQVLRITFVDWADNEIGFHFSSAMDLISDAIGHLSAQTAVLVMNIRLMTSDGFVSAGQPIEIDQPWSTYPTYVVAPRVVVTILDSPGNVLAPFDLDTAGRSDLSANPLRLVQEEGVEVVLSKKGMEVKEGSGERGFFCATFIGDVLHGSSIGLSLKDVNLNDTLGGSTGGCGWWSGTSRGYLHSKLLGIAPINGQICLRFNDGDRVGLMVDCSAVPRLRFFVNDQQVFETDMATEVHGLMVFPAFAVSTGELHIVADPDLPT